MSVLSEAVLQTTRDVASRRSHQGGAHDRGNNLSPEERLSNAQSIVEVLERGEEIPRGRDGRQRDLGDGGRSVSPTVTRWTAAWGH